MTPLPSRLESGAGFLACGLVGLSGLRNSFSRCSGGQASRQSLERGTGKSCEPVDTNARAAWGLYPA